MFSILLVGTLSAQNLSLSPKVNQGHDSFQSPTDLVEVHYDGDNNNSIGDGGTTYIGGARFRPELFTDLVGGEFQFISFFYSQEATGLTILIYDAGTATEPGDLLLEQPLDLGSLTIGDWNTVALSSILTISGNDLWVCLQVEDASASNYPFGVDAGPADPDGDFVNDSGTWQHLSDFGLDYNWNIRALIEPPTGGSTIVFFDDFESYTAGEQLACQNPTDWTTWSEAPCDATEDAYVSNAYAYSGVNSVNIVQNNDLVKTLGDLTGGKWGISFFMYIPTDAEAYFNTLSSFTGGVYEWAMEAYFYTGAAGSLNAGGTGTATFTFPYDTWFPVLVVVDLNNDMAEFWVDGVQVYSWQWTLGALGGGTSLQLAANDFYGHAATADWYFDDYQFEDLHIVPVELTSFTANVNTSGQVVLNWTTATELNNQMFEIQRSADNNQFITIGYVDGQGTTTEPQEYSYVDKTVETGKYFYRLKQIDFGGQYEYSDVTEVDVNGPLTYSLEQNYPNPFNPSTVIKYSVANAGHVRLVVYNLVGEEVSVLVNGMVDAGFYQVSFDASNLPSGIYLYKLEAPGFVQIKKMMLMK